MNAGGAKATWSPAAATRAQKASDILNPAAAITAWNGDGTAVQDGKAAKKAVKECMCYDTTSN